MPEGYVTTDGIDFNEIYYDGIVPAVDLYRRVEMPVIMSIVQPHPETIIKYGVSEKNGYQQLSLGERPNRKYVQEAALYPEVKKWGYGVGSDIDTMRRSTRRQIEMAVDRGFAEDGENVLLQLLKKLMKNPGTNNAEHGFYNGQFSTEEKITAPPSYQNNTFLAAHSHFVTTGSASLNALTPITAAKQTIRHHGNTGPLAAFINSQEVQALEDLANFTSTSIIRATLSDQVTLFGFTDNFTLLGVNWWATEMIPAGYILIVETSPVDQRRPVIQFEPANMRGLNLMPGVMNDYPIIESYFERWIGYRVLNRGAGVALQITASGTYTDPTFNE